MDDLFEGGRKLPLVEDFYTIQGEGHHTGKAAYFIRLGGCDSGCSWCDARYTWNRELHPLVPADEIIGRASHHRAGSVVVTGGEPSLYPLDYLCSRLKEHGIKTFVETSGSAFLTGEWDWICLSPKKQDPPVAGMYEKADELKVIICNESDLEWAETNARKVSRSCLLYLQPEWSRYEKIIPAVVDYVKENPGWMVSLQAHKFMRIP